MENKEDDKMKKILEERKQQDISNRLTLIRTLTNKVCDKNDNALRRISKS